MRFEEVLQDVISGRSAYRVDYMGDIRAMKYNRERRRVSFTYLEASLIKQQFSEAECWAYCPTMEDICALDWGLDNLRELVPLAEQIKEGWKEQGVGGIR